MMTRISSENLYAALDEHLNTLDLIHRACAVSQQRRQPRLCLGTPLASLGAFLTAVARSA